MREDRLQGKSSHWISGIIRVDYTCLLLAFQTSAWIYLSFSFPLNDLLSHSASESLTESALLYLSVSFLALVSLSVSVYLFVLVSLADLVSLSSCVVLVFYCDQHVSSAG